MKYIHFVLALFVVLGLIVAPVFSFSVEASVISRGVSSPEEFQKALNDGVQDIIIMKSIKGNWKIPRWVHSISGTDNTIVVSPEDEGKPVFYLDNSNRDDVANDIIGAGAGIGGVAGAGYGAVQAGSLALLVPVVGPVLAVPAAVVGGIVGGAAGGIAGGAAVAIGEAVTGTLAESYSTAQEIKLNDMTILCGHGIGIEANSLNKPLSLSKINFKGLKDERKNEIYIGLQPSKTTIMYKCTFENLTHGIRPASSSEYGITVKECTFRNVFDALGCFVLADGTCKFQHCSGVNLQYWAALNQVGSMIVQVDHDTLSVSPESDFFHKVKYSGKSSEQLQKYIDGLEQAFMFLPPEIKSALLGKSEYDVISALSELWERCRDINFKNGEPNEIKTIIQECFNLYTMVVSAPVRELFNSSGKIERVNVVNLCSMVASRFVNNKDIATPIANAFLDARNLALFSRVSQNVFWGNHVYSVFRVNDTQDNFASNTELNFDELFYQNIRVHQDWLSAMNDALGYMKNLRVNVEKEFSYDALYTSTFNKTLKGINELGTAANKMRSVIVFDLPIELLFTSFFALLIDDNDPDNIIKNFLGLASGYNISQKLSMLNRTNIIRDELLKVLKEKLAEKGLIWTSYKRYDELIRSFRTKKFDLFQEVEKLSNLSREWQ